MKLKSLKNAKVDNKVVLVKVDLNVPLKNVDSKVEIVDDTRIKLTLPTINYLRDKNCKIILMSHLGRPNGKVVKELRMDPIAKRLSEELGSTVIKSDHVVGAPVKKVVENLKEKEVLLLENNRFEPGEMKNDPDLSKQIADLADIFVNDGFSLSHRSHASVVGVTDHLPSYAGFALEREVFMLSKLTTNPKSPFVAIVGGAKISDKIDAIKNLSSIADVVLVGGGVANNFLKAEGVDVYSSYMQDVVADEKKLGVDYVQFAKELMDQTRKDKILIDGYIPVSKIVYPVDVIAADCPDETENTRVVELTNKNLHEKQNSMYLDIGPKTRKLYSEIIRQARTVFWNGPMGKFENKKFEKGTKAIAKAIANSKATSILGGGDTISAINSFGYTTKYDYLSASGGASLEFLGGKKLPGLIPLLK